MAEYGAISHSADKVSSLDKKEKYFPNGAANHYYNVDDQSSR